VEVRGIIICSGKHHKIYRATEWPVKYGEPEYCEVGVAGDVERATAELRGCGEFSSASFSCCQKLLLISGLLSTIPIQNGQLEDIRLRAGS